MWTYNQQRRGQRRIAQELNWPEVHSFYWLLCLSRMKNNKQTKLNKQSTQLVHRWYRAEPDSSAELQSFHPMQHWYRIYPSIWAVKFLCTECETHRFGSCIDAPPQIGTRLTYFSSTVPESFSYSMTWYTSCRWLTATLVPCFLVQWTVE